MLNHTQVFVGDTYYHSSVRSKGSCLILKKIEYPRKNGSMTYKFLVRWQNGEEKEELASILRKTPIGSIKGHSPSQQLAFGTRKVTEST